MLTRKDLIPGNKYDLITLTGKLYKNATFRVWDSVPYGSINHGYEDFITEKGNEVTFADSNMGPDKYVVIFEAGSNYDLPTDRTVREIL